MSLVEYSTRLILSVYSLKWNWTDNCSKPKRFCGSREVKNRPDDCRILRNEEEISSKFQVGIGTWNYGTMELWNVFRIVENGARSGIPFPKFLTLWHARLRQTPDGPTSFGKPNSHLPQVWNKTFHFPGQSFGFLPFHPEPIAIDFRAARPAQSPFLAKTALGSLDRSAGVASGSDLVNPDHSFSIRQTPAENARRSGYRSHRPRGAEGTFGRPLSQRCGILSTGTTTCQAGCAAELEQLENEAALMNDLLSESIPEILRQAVGVRNRPGKSGLRMLSRAIDFVRCLRTANAGRLSHRLPTHARKEHDSCRLGGSSDFGSNLIG